MLKRLLKKSIAMLLVATLIFTSQAFFVFAEGVNANSDEEETKVSETLEETYESAEIEETEEKIEEKEETEEKIETEESEIVIPDSEEEDNSRGELDEVAPSENRRGELDEVAPSGVTSPDSKEITPEVEDEEEIKETTEYAEEPEEETTEEKIEETTEDANVGANSVSPEEETPESVEETTEEKIEETTETDDRSGEIDDNTRSGELASQDEETSEESTSEKEAVDIDLEDSEKVNDKVYGLYWALQYTYDNFLNGTKTVKFAYNPILWELEGIDTNDPNSMWILDPNATQHATQITLLCNYEKFADGTYNIDEFDFPNFVSTGYGSGVDELVFKMEYVPIDPNVTYNFFDDYEMTDDKISNFGSDPHENFKNYYLDDYMGGTLFFSAPSQTANNITLVIGNGLTSMNSEAAYYIPLYLDAEARNERFNRIVEDLKSRFGEDVYIRGLGKGTGRTGTTFSTSTVVQNATQVTNLLTDENYETLILNETSNKKYFLVFGYYSVDSQKTWRLIIDDRFGHFTNETGLDEDGYFTYTIYNDPSDVVLPEMELINGVFYDNEFTGVGFTDSVNGTIDQLYAKFLMWLKSKGSTFVSQTYTADFVQTNLWFNFDNALHLSKTGPTHYWLKEMFDIVPPTIQKYNGSHYIFDKWTDVDGNELDLDEFVAAYQANPSTDVTIYAREKVIEEKIIFDMSGFTSDMGTYEGDTEFYADATNWAPPTINCNSDYTFVGWSKEKYATALVTLEEITAEITEWKENLEGNKTYYPVFIGKPMLHYTVDTNKGTVYDMPYGKMSFKYDEYTSDELFAARPEINGNFGYNFIGWNINSQYVELDDVANIIDTWALDPSEDLVLEAAFESVGTLTLNIDTTKIEIADDPTGIQTANQIKLDGKTYAWPNITFNTIDDDIVFLGFGTGDNLIIPIDEIDSEYPGLINLREDLVYDTIYRNKNRFTFNTTGITGKGSINGTLSFKEDEVSSIVEPTIAENDDYEFLGWTKDTSNNTIISVNDAINEWNLTSDYNLYPVFKTLYNVIYEVRTTDTNKATVDFTGLPHIYRMPKRASTNTAAVTNIINAKPDTAITRNKGYRFTGWSVNNEDLTVDALTEAIENATNDLYIYAEFEELKLFRINIENDKVKLSSNESAIYVEYDSEEDIDTNLTFVNVAGSGKKFIGFSSGATTIAPSELEDAFDNWKSTGATENIDYYTIYRDLHTFKVNTNPKYFTVSGDATIYENQNSDETYVTLPTINARPGYLFNNEYSLTEEGTALTNEELQNLINPWDGLSNVVIFALHEDDVDAVRATIVIDSNKGSNVNIQGGKLEIFEVAEFDAMKALVTSVSGKSNYKFKNWTVNGTGEYLTLSEVDWDGLNNITVEAVFERTSNPSNPSGGRPSSGSSGGSSGGSGAGGGIRGVTTNGGTEFIKYPSPIGPNAEINNKDAGGGRIPGSGLLYIKPIETKDASYVLKPADDGFINHNEDTSTKQYAWSAINHHGDWGLLDTHTNEFYKDGWAYLEYKDHWAWYHFGNDGKMTTGWYTEDGMNYYLSADNTNDHYGRMLTGVNIINGHTYLFGVNGKLVAQLD